MQLHQPYYIEPRKNDSHLDLNGSWEFFFSDERLEQFSEEMWQYQTKIPNSIYHSLHEAGVLPDPYVGTNSTLYHWVDEKIWYYRKRFSLQQPDFDGNAYLCFDGIAYYARVWVNGIAVGEHEGMFGGPIVDVKDMLCLSGENEIIVEVRACNFGQKDSFEPRNEHGINTQIVPWAITRDKVASTGDFIVLGLWNSVRLELLDKVHISRPYLVTEKIDDGKAVLQLELEIADGSVAELHPYYGRQEANRDYTFAYATGLTGRCKDETVTLQVTIRERTSGIVAYSAEEEIALTDFDRMGMDERYHECQFVRKEIVLDNPKLWYPNGLGEAFLYTVELSLYKDGKRVDTQCFDYGIRTFTDAPTAGRKYRTGWGKFLFSMNGEEMFVQGMNWMPIDFLYGIPREEYAWCLTLAKNAGIQMLRVWSGGGMPETDAFYEICDRLGIMVWQDHMIANMEHTQNFPQDVLEAQEAMNLYRIRNHASLVLHCGGNEFNPYTYDNAASMFVIDRTIRMLDPSRIFHYTSPDQGSAHIYIDMEPVWYRHYYKEIPFVAESGIHSFPAYQSLKKLISEQEATAPLPDLAAPAFAEQCPDLLNHFTEYLPDRVPRMLARASQIMDISHCTLEEMCEATQVQAYEFYTIMIQSMQENYPRCGGVMPWVFRRPWATVGIQVVDGLGQPTIPYYAIQNTYRQNSIFLSLQWSILAPWETVPLEAQIFSRPGTDLTDGTVTVTLYAPDLTVAYEATQAVTPGMARYSFEPYTLDERFTDQCFLLCVELKKGGCLLSRSTYFPKCLKRLQNPEQLAALRNAPAENLYFSEAPWLKPCIEAAKQATLTVTVKPVQENSFGYPRRTVMVQNMSDTPAYPVVLEVVGQDIRHMESDNFFLLAPGEQREVVVTLDRTVAETAQLAAKAWNCETVTVKL